MDGYGRVELRLGKGVGGRPLVSASAHMGPPPYMGVMLQTSVWVRVQACQPAAVATRIPNPVKMPTSFPQFPNIPPPPAPEQVHLLLLQGTVLGI